MMCGSRIGWVHCDYEDEAPIKTCDKCYKHPEIKDDGVEYLVSK